MTRRLDTVTAVTRVLLDNSTFSEAVTLQRCARLLAGEIADWVLIDIERGGRLLRQFAAGPRAAQADQLARVARGADPDPDSVPAQVHAAGKSVLLAHPDDPAALGRTPEGHAAADDARRDLADLRADLRRDDRLRRADPDCGWPTRDRSASPTWRWPRSSAGTWRSPSGSTGCSASAPRSPRRCRRACCRPGCRTRPGSSSPPPTSARPSSRRSAATSTTSSRRATAGRSRSATSAARARTPPP